LCGRPLIEGPSVDRHHLVPKAAGGRTTVQLHRICHRKIHSVLDERALVHSYADVEALKAHPEIERFVAWVRNKPPTFYARTAPKGGRRR
jgi:hypothetical protein